MLGVGTVLTKSVCLLQYRSYASGKGWRREDKLRTRDDENVKAVKAKGEEEVTVSMHLKKKFETNNEFSPKQCRGLYSSK